MSYKRDYNDSSHGSHGSHGSHSSHGSHESREERRRRKKSRWGGDESDRVVIPGLPTIIPSNLTKEQQEIYLLQIQIETINKQLRTGDLGIPEDIEARSPSPEPVYNSDGKRLNTREFRVRKRLEDERHQLITKMLTLNPSYTTPPDYKPPQTKLSDKVLIPQEEYPDINFVGLLIGPRGNTLKAMEKDTGAKIIIRGKGSIKEGKLGRKDGQPLPGEDEPLHAFLTAPTEDSIAAATKQIMKIIRQAIELPENQNNLRRTQLRELALLNGTLRENDVLRQRVCSNCGSTEHRNWQCPEKQNMVNQMVCTKCNGKGHLEKDCKFVPENGADVQVNQSKIDEEYLSFMSELGECSPPRSKSNSSGAHTAVSNSTTSAADGGPLALTYDRHDKHGRNEDGSKSDGSHGHKGSSNGQAKGLLPTPGRRDRDRRDRDRDRDREKSSSDKPKLVTWIQKQGVWKQVVQDAPSEPSPSHSSGDHKSAAPAATAPMDSQAASLIPGYISADPTALNYYTLYYQQALATGQDMTAASATALSHYTAYANYAGYAAASTTATAGDQSSSSKYSQAYNSVPPPNQIMAGTTVATSPNTTIPSTAYGYAMPTSTMAPNSNYSAAYAAYAAYGYGTSGYGAVNAPSAPPPPPE